MSSLVPITPAIPGLAQAMVASGLFADLRDASQAIVKIVWARELGFGPCAGISGISIIRGRPMLSANLMAAMIKRITKYNYRVKHLDDTRCEIEFLEQGEPIGVSRFTFEDARKAGLATGTNWRTYPRNM